MTRAAKLRCIKTNHSWAIGVSPSDPNPFVKLPISKVPRAVVALCKKLLAIGGKQVSVRMSWPPQIPEEPQDDPMDVVRHGWMFHGSKVVLLRGFANDCHANSRRRMEKYPGRYPSITEEPGAVVPHAGICAGAAGYPAALRRRPLLAIAMLESDPRVFFAAERTLLAWLRTGLTIIALGFVVARLGLFLQLLSAQPQPGSAQVQSGPSAVLGVLFVVVGAIAILVATVQHRRYVSTLPQSDLPSSYSRTFAVALSALIGVLGLMLAAYLTFSHA